MLGAEFISGHYLPGKGARLLEPIGVQRNLSDHRVVRDHHGDRPEQRFQVIRQLRSASVARVHSDEAVCAFQQREVDFFEKEPVLLFGLG